MLKISKNEFIKNSGGCIVSKNIIEGKGKIKWVFREESVNENDNGWRFFSDIDDDQYVNDANNLIVCDYNTVANIEPALISIYLFPVGTDFEFIIKDNKKYFLNNSTRELIEIKIR